MLVGEGKMEVYNFFVAGIPKPQPRPRITKSGHVYTPESVKVWKDAVKLTALKHFDQTILTEPLVVTIRFYLPKPKGMKQLGKVFHSKKPDIDNLLKSTLDALCPLWEDDSLVSRVYAEKYYGDEAGGAYYHWNIA